MSTQPAFEIDSENRAQIEQLAASRGLTVNEVVGQALAIYTFETESQDELLARAQAAWEDYQSTGLHLTGEEVDEWLAKIEAGENPPMPPCHT